MVRITTEKGKVKKPKLVDSKRMEKVEEARRAKAEVDQISVIRREMAKLAAGKNRFAELVAKRRLKMKKHK